MALVRITPEAVARYCLAVSYTHLRKEAGKVNEEQFFLSLMAILSATVLGFTLMCIYEI